MTFVDKKAKAFTLAIVGLVGVLFFGLGILSVHDWWASPSALPVFPRGVPSNVTISNALTFRTTEHADRQYSFQFDRINALEHRWSGSSGRVTVHTDTSDENLGIVVIEPLHSDDWGDQIDTAPSDPEGAGPWMSATVTVPPSLVHTWVKVKAQMDVVYPIKNTSNWRAFSNEREPLEVESPFFVVSPEELGVLDRIAEYNRGKGDGEGAIGFLVLRRCWYWLCDMVLAHARWHNVGRVRLYRALTP